MPDQRMLVRILVGAVLGLALAACVTLPLLEELPAVALGQASLYRLEVALVTFYGCLLLVTPAHSGLVAGRLPIEISTRGARFAAEADKSAAINTIRIEELRRIANDLTEALAAVELEIVELRDGTQRKVDSKR